jgi:hypothetical protein
MTFPFDISATDGRARTGVLKTRARDIRTPAFMPVGTAGTVKAMTADAVRDHGRADGARQHLPPDAAPGRRAVWRAWAACTASWTGTARS